MTERILLAVAGAHLSGMPLNHELTSRGAQLERCCRTSVDYLLYALCGTYPPKPGLVRRPGFVGPGIEIEVWSIAVAAFGEFVAHVPAPMTIGNVELDDGATVKGFCCEPHALEGSEDITGYASWRRYLASQSG
jgi:allophanate hydrolase